MFGAPCLLCFLLRASAGRSEEQIMLGAPCLFSVRFGPWHIGAGASGRGRVAWAKELGRGQRAWAKDLGEGLDQRTSLMTWAKSLGKQWRWKESALFTTSFIGANGHAPCTPICSERPADTRSKTSEIDTLHEALSKECTRPIHSTFIQQVFIFSTRIALKL